MCVNIGERDKGPELDYKSENHRFYFSSYNKNLDKGHIILYKWFCDNIEDKSTFPFLRK